MKIAELNECIKHVTLSIDENYVLSHPGSIRMYRPWKGTLYTHNHIRFADVFEYDDTGNISICVIEKILASVTGEIIFVKSMDKYKMYIEKDSGKVTITKNKRLCYTSRELRYALATFVEASRKLLAIRPYIVAAFSITERPRDPWDDTTSPRSLDVDALLYSYRVTRNKRLKDLPWTGYNLHKLYQDVTPERVKARSSMNYYLRLGKSREATNACFYGYVFPKSIRKILIQIGPLYFSKDLYAKLFEVLKTVRVEVVKNILFDIYDDNKTHMLTVELLHLLEKGFNIPPKISYSFHSMLQDTMYMYNTPGVVLDNLPETKSVKELHDVLVFRVEDLRKLGDPKTKLYESVNVGRPELNYTTQDGFEFKCIEFVTDLFVLGKTLHNCVYSYANRVFVGYLSIVAMYEVGETMPLVCIEVKSNHIVQAKASWNQPVNRHPQLQKQMVEWAEASDLVLNCEDVHTGAERREHIPVPMVEPDLLRIALVEEVEKTARALRLTGTGGGYGNQDNQFEPRPQRVVDYQLVQADDIPF